MPVENTSTTRTLSTIPTTGLVPALAAPDEPGSVHREGCQTEYPNGPWTGHSGKRRLGSPHGPRRVHLEGPRVELERLGDRIAELSARIQAATWQPMAKPPLHSTGDASRLNCVARRSHIANMLAPHVLSAGRLTGLGATRGFAMGC